jgi:hypothetical protein
VIKTPAILRYAARGIDHKSSKRRAARGTDLQAAHIFNSQTTA